MQKFITAIYPFEQLRRGMLVEAPGGYMRFHSLEYLQSGYVRLTLIAGDGATTWSVCHSSNWREVAIGFTPEYQAAYPDEHFE